MATGDAYWEVGTLTVPGSTGSVAVTGLSSTPRAVFFWGTNWLAEDTAVTTASTGLFRGMAAPKWDDAGTIEQNSASVQPAGLTHHTADGHCINMFTSGTTHLYAAILTSFDANGYTLNWDIVTGGGYKVVYAALFGAAMDVGAYVGTGALLTLGWKAGASLLHGAVNGPETADSDRTAEFYGGGAYPTASSGNWMGAGLAAQTFPTSASAQYNIGIFDDPPNVDITQTGVFLGPFFSPQDVLAHPSGTDFQMTFTTGNGGMVVMWDDEDSATGRVTPPDNETDVVTVSGLPFRPGLLVGYSISDEPQGLGTGGRGAVGFSVVSTEFQWTALVDGVSSRGSFQSFQRGFASNVSGTSVHAGTIELTADGFTMEAVEDDLAPVTWVWHAFGHPLPILKWIPHIYRRLFATGGDGPVPPAEFLLLGGGTDRLLLETGDGFLIL